MKTCTKCGVCKDAESFYVCELGKDERRGACKDCMRSARKKRYQSPSGRRRALDRQKEYERRPEVRKKRAEYQRLYGRAYHSREDVKKRTNERLKIRRDNCPAYRLRVNVSEAVKRAMRSSGSSKAGKATFAHLPYTPGELRSHLESLWEPWMDWNNYGSGPGRWTIDHIIPQSVFHYTSLEDPAFVMCWSLKNLRPMEYTENISKGRKLVLRSQQVQLVAALGEGA